MLWKHLRRSNHKDTTKSNTRRAHKSDMQAASHNMNAVARKAAKRELKKAHAALARMSTKMKAMESTLLKIRAKHRAAIKVKVQHGVAKERQRLLKLEHAARKRIAKAKADAKEAVLS